MPENRKWITFRLQSEYFATEFKFFFRGPRNTTLIRDRIYFWKKNSMVNADYNNLTTLLSLISFSLHLQLYFPVYEITEKDYFKVHSILKFHTLLYESMIRNCFCINIVDSV